MPQLDVREVTGLLYTPLRKIKAPGTGPRERRGLRRLPPWCNRLKLVHGLAGLEELADEEPRESMRALLLSVRILATLGAVRGRDPSPHIHLAGVVMALYDLRSLPDGEALPDLQLSAEQDRAAAKFARTTGGILNRAEMNGFREKLQWSALRLVSHLFETAHICRKTGQVPGDLVRSREPSLGEATILRKLARGAFLDEVGDLEWGPVWR